MKIRKANIQDAKNFIEIKNRLKFEYVNEKSTKGGFLLGTNEETYKKYIQNEIVLVAELNEKIVGFGIILKNESVKKSDIWQKRSSANWKVDINKFKNISCCYFEQLAFLPGHSRMVFSLCFEILQLAFKEHESLFTTTVYYPIINLAAVPFILRSGGEKIGKIDEEYPVIGKIVSDIYLINKQSFDLNIVESHRYNFLKKHEL